MEVLIGHATYFALLGRPALRVEAKTTLSSTIAGSKLRPNAQVWVPLSHTLQDGLAPTHTVSGVHSHTHTPPHHTRVMPFNIE